MNPVQHRYYYSKMRKIDPKNKSLDGIENQIKNIIQKIESEDIHEEYTGVTLYYLKRRLRNKK